MIKAFYIFVITLVIIGACAMLWAEEGEHYCLKCGEEEYPICKKCTEIYWAEEDRLVIFTELEDTWIDFDFENNKWIYNGDLQEIKEQIIKYKDEVLPGVSLGMVEIYRQLKEKTNEDTNSKFDVIDRLIGD